MTNGPEDLVDGDVDPVGGGPSAAELWGEEADEVSSLDRVRTPRADEPATIHAAKRSPEEVVSLLREARSAAPSRAALAIRASSDALDLVATEFPAAEVDREGRACALGPVPTLIGDVCIVSDGPLSRRVAAEAALTARTYGTRVRRVTDLTGLTRIVTARQHLETADCVVVVAGQDAALASVVADLVDVPLVAVPTSDGHQTFGGVASLIALLGSSPPGVVVCGIDNGFGAGVFAARLARRAHRGPAGA